MDAPFIYDEEQEAAKGRETTHYGLRLILPLSQILWEGFAARGQERP
jgi:hypothetical protein